MISLYSDTMEEHVRHVETVLEVLKKYEFTLAKKKYEWAQTEVNYLAILLDMDR